MHDHDALCCQRAFTGTGEVDQDERFQRFDVGWALCEDEHPLTTVPDDPVQQVEQDLVLGATASLLSLIHI